MGSDIFDTLLREQRYLSPVRFSPRSATRALLQAPHSLQQRTGTTPVPQRQPYNSHHNTKYHLHPTDTATHSCHRTMLPPNADAPFFMQPPLCKGMPCRTSSSLSAATPREIVNEIIAVSDSLSLSQKKPSCQTLSMCVRVVQTHPRVKADGGNSHGQVARAALHCGRGVSSSE